MAVSTSTRCTVKIIAPNGTTFTFHDSAAADQALLAVETQKDLAQAVGSFTLHFAPTRDREGRHWDERIPKRSLVFIDMERLGDSGPKTGKPTVMVGLTDLHTREEQWQEANPRQRVSIHGRELSCVILDAMLFFHPGLAAHPASGTLTETSLGLGAHLVALTYNPNLSKEGEDPRLTIKRLLDFYLFVGGESVAPSTTPGSLQQPVISLDLPNVKLADLLQTPTAFWNTFEPVVVPLPQSPSELGSLWNLLHLYIDRAFQEFFTRIEDGVCRIYFRGKPFLHRLVKTGTRFKTTQHEPTLHTLRLDGADILSQQRQCSTDSVYNVFLVSPLGMTDSYHNPSFYYEVLPEYVKDPAHPSYIGRYGLRIMQVKSMYLTPLGSPGQLMTPATPQPLRPPPASAAVWAPKANQLAAEENLPAALRPWFVALIQEESHFDPTAQGQLLRSGNRAEGIAQWVAPYPAGVGLVNPYDPENALRAAARYWNQMRAMPWIGDDPVLLVAGYNAGPGAVQQYKGVPPFQETQQLIGRVTAAVPHYQGMAGATTAVARPLPNLADPLTQAVVDPVKSLAVTGKTTPPGATGNYPEFVEAAKRWAAILLGWYDMGGELFAALLTLRGHPGWNVGHRLLSHDERGEWEAYIEGVGHRYDMRTGQYLTQLRLTRGWYLSAALTSRLWQEGRTQVTATTGGPPTQATPAPDPDPKSKYAGTPVLQIRPQRTPMSPDFPRDTED